MRDAGRRAGVAAGEKRPGPASILTACRNGFRRGALRGKGLPTPGGLKRVMWAVSVALIRRSFSPPVLCITAIVDPALHVRSRGARQLLPPQGEPS
jgi:hypothetical protein